MTCTCGCNQTYLEKRKDGTTFEVVFSKDSAHCKNCGTLANKNLLRGGLCIDCLYKKVMK
jgi:hypothetical protein